MGKLEVIDLVKRFGDRTVLDNISLTVGDGEFFVLLGPSGGGKSTLMKIVCGIETADSGQIFLGGREITHSSPRDRNVGMVFQDYGLYPHMNVFENIAYGLEARRVPKEEIHKRATEAAAKLGLSPLIDRIIVDLSGGEQQRVALARALAKDADIYLFDEPISNLDPKLRAQARRDIQMVHRSKQKPTLYVTHDQNEALAIGDRIAIIAAGKLQQVGTADDLIQHPANMFVAGFLGAPAMNLISSSLSFNQQQDTYSVQLSPQVSMALPDGWKSVLGTYRKDKIIVGIPPAAFEFGRSDHPMEVEILDFEPLVSEVVISFNLPGGRSVSAVSPDIDESQLVIGSKIPVSIDTSRLCLFDPQTEQALVQG